MKKFIARTMRKSAFRARPLETSAGSIIGDINAIFRVGNAHLFMDCWLAGEVGDIIALEVLDNRGTIENVSFSASKFARNDVNDVLKDSSFAAKGFGYRILLALPDGCSRLHGVTFHFNAVSHHQPIGKSYTDALLRDRKISLIANVPEMYGLPDVLNSDPYYKQSILERSRALFEDQTSFEAYVEGWHRLDNGSLLMFGWIDDTGRVQGAGTLADDTGNDSEQSAHMLRYFRPDLNSSPHEPLGMLMFIESSSENPPFSLHFRTEDRGDVFLTATGAEPAEKELLSELLTIYDRCRQTDLAPDVKHELSAKFIPMIEQLYLTGQQEVFPAEQMNFGPPISDPEITVVIPIYKSYELTRHQIADFSTDPFVVRQEIIFVLDSPEDRQKFKLLLHSLHELYRVPFRLLVMNRNGGFARACNAGASAARATNLLFLNSDVFPKRRGWMSSMLSRLEGDESVGVVGARLLFPDESIQHVGLSWRRLGTHDDQLINHHPWKGMDPMLVPHHGAVEVPAVTAACLLCRTDEFKTLGMFDVGFIRGDCEDSDFCLKVRQSGKRIICDNDAELYHLEGNSYPSEERRKVFYYNAMRQELRWDESIAELTHRNLIG